MPSQKLEQHLWALSISTNLPPQTNITQKVKKKSLKSKILDPLISTKYTRLLFGVAESVVKRVKLLV